MDLLTILVCDIFYSARKINYFPRKGQLIFFRYGSHIELIRFKEYYGMPRGHEDDPMYSLSIYARFSGQFFFTFSQKKNVMGKKDRCAVFGCNNDRLFPEKYTMKFSFCPISRPFQILLGNVLATFRILSNFFVREQLLATFRKTSTFLVTFGLF